MPDGTTPIMSMDGPGWDEDRRLWIPVLEDGTYYVEVQDAGGQGGYEHWYWVHAAWNLPPEQEDPPRDPIVVESEPNGVDGPQSSGLALPASGTDLVELWARIGEAGDEDWYAMDLLAGDRVTATFARTEFAGETTRLSVELQAPDGTVVASGAWDGEEAAVLSLIEAPSDGVFHLVVTEQSPDEGSGGHYYFLTLSALRS